MNHTLDNDKIIDSWAAFYARTGSSYMVDFRALAADFLPERHTHLLHSYPAKLLPHIPTFFLKSSKCGGHGSTRILADPFCGSGTVLLEGALSGLQVVGADPNPLARLIARVKTNPLHVQSIHEALSIVNRRMETIVKSEPPDVVNLSLWYSAPVAMELCKLRATIAEIKPRPLREFMLVCFSVCVRKMSNADPRLSVPVKINLKRKARYGQHFGQLKRHLDHLKQENVLPTFNLIVQRNAVGMESLRRALKKKPLVSIFDDARALHSHIGVKSVDLIITSPPYVGAQKYIRSSSLSLGWLDLAESTGLRPLERSTIGREHFNRSEMQLRPIAGVEPADKLIQLIREKNPLRAHIASTYLKEIRSALGAMHSVLRRGGQMIMVAGPNTICGYHFDTPSFIEEMAHQVGFATQFKLVDHIRSRGLMTKRNKTAGLISSEMVLCLRPS